MDKSTFIIMVLSLILFLAPRTQTQHETNSGTRKKADVPEIAVTNLDVSDKNFNLRYEIRNDSLQDVWILMGIGKSGSSATEFIGDDGQTLYLRRWFGVPMRARGNAIDGRYARLRPEESQTESVSLSIPLLLSPGFAGKPGAQGLATRFVIEIGYYDGDLPRMINQILEEEEKIIDERPVVYPIYPTTIKDWFGGLLGFNENNEVLRQRDEEVLIPYTDQMLKGEQVLRLTIDDVCVPYKESNDLSIKRYPPDLTPCTRVEIEYQPSMLKYFFPYAGQQSLLSREEIDYLRNGKTIVVEASQNLKAFANDLDKGIPAGGIVRERSKAHVVCYRDSEYLMSFPIYNDESIIKEGKRFIYFDGFPSLKMLSRRTQSIELRIQCSANLRNLWHRLRLYKKAAESLRIGFFRRRENKPYPSVNKWCDYMILAYKSIGVFETTILRPYTCPGAAQGNCHYAMNPNCKYDSPPDVVLLFETKAGWNQHGGPELFTFDNHDPKGGCVLLNDGTVKFIRTKEELQQLRWK